MRPTMLLTTVLLLVPACQREGEPNSGSEPSPAQSGPDTQSASTSASTSGGADLQVLTPPGLQQGDPLTAGKVVWVSRSEVRFEGRTIARLVDGQVDEQYIRGGHLIEPLYEVLIEAGVASRRQAEFDGVKWDEPLVFAADERTPYTTIVNLLFTASRSEYRNFGFVIGPLGPTLYKLPFELPVYGEDPNERSDDAPVLARHLRPDILTNRGRSPDVVGPVLSLELTAEGVSIGRGDASPPRAYPDQDGIAITQAADALREVYPEARHVVISAEGDVPLRDVMSAMIAARAPSCKANGEACKLPNVILTSGHAHEFQTPAANRMPDPMWGALPGVEVSRTVPTRELIKPGSVRMPEAASVTLEKPQVAGEIDPDIVRRIVRAHLQELRSCTRLVDDPVLGRVVLEFAISSSGKVTSAQLGDSEIPETVGKCMVKATKRWIFPKPRSGVVSVVFPLKVSPR